MNHNISNHPLKTNNKPTPQQSPSHSPDITRPTLKRITADHHQNQRNNHSPSNSINQIWFTKHPPQSSPSNSTRNSPPISPRQTPLAHNPIRFKSDRDVLIHQVEQNQTLPGIALSYGISLAALRKANRMWESDPLDMKSTLRIPLASCNLTPSKKIEIEQDSGKVLIYEPNSRSSQSSSSLSTSTIHSDQPFPSSSTHSRPSNMNYNQNNLHSDTSQSLLGLDLSSSVSNHSSSDSYQYPQLGQLAPISNTDSPPPVSDVVVRVATLENGKSHQLNPEASSSKTISPSLVIPDSSYPSSSTKLVHSSSNHLRQRTRHSSSPHQISSNSQPSTSSSCSSSKTPTTRSSPIPIPNLNDSDHSPSDNGKKPNFNFFSSNRIPSLPPFLHTNLNNLFGNEEESDRVRRTGQSKWTTVRPGKPPRLGQALSFLEEPTTMGSNKIGQVVSNAIEGIFNSRVVQKGVDDDRRGDESHEIVEF